MEQIENELENLGNLLTTALTASDVALWEWSIDQPSVCLNENYYRMLGYDPLEKPLGKTVWIDYGHPEDEDRLRTMAMEAAAGKSEVLNAEFRARRKDGRYCWLLLRGRTVGESADGRPARMVGTIIGISEKKQWEKALAESRRRHHTLLDSLPGMAYRIRHRSGEWIMEFVSEGCVGLTGFSPSELIENRETYLNLIHPDDKEAVWAEVEKAVRNHRKYEMVYRIKTASKEDKWVWERGTGVFSRQSKLIAIEGFTTDITAYQEAQQDLKAENIRLKTVVQEQHRFGRLIGKSSKMQTIYNLILQAAASTASVMLYGESGTGKELVAQEIHELSDRKFKSFVSVNCGAIPENLMESEFFGYKKGAFTGADKDKPGYLDRADGGTLFLDEIGEIHPNMQVKLLRAVEGGGYTPIGGERLKQPNIRIVCATNRDLKEMVRKGLMRKDFFYRIHIIPIQLPPLRERKEDIPLLSFYFLEQFSNGGQDFASIPSDIKRAMMEYEWPGNVRELQNLIHRYVSLSKVEFYKTQPFGGKLALMRFNDGCDDIPDDASLSRAVMMFEKRHIENVLSQHGGNRTHAAKGLGIGLRTLQRKIKAYDIL